MIIKAQDPLLKYVTLVCLIHLLFLTILYLTQFWGDGLSLWKGKQIQLVQSSIRVDLVAMPKFTLRELRQMQIPPAASEQSQGQQKLPPSAESRSSDQGPSFLDKIKQFSRKKVQVKKTSKKTHNKVRRKQGRGENRELDKLILAGNKLSTGVALTGNINNEELTELRRYMESLPQFVRPHWVLPSYLKEQELKCRIQIFIGRGGKLLKSNIIESSGDSQYDNYAQEALEKAQFPVPNDSLLKELVKGVAVLGFPL